MPRKWLPEPGKTNARGSVVCELWVMGGQRGDDRHGSGSLGIRSTLVIPTSGCVTDVRRSGDELTALGNRLAQLIVCGPVEDKQPGREGHGKRDCRLRGPRGFCQREFDLGSIRPGDHRVKLTWSRGPILQPGLRAMGIAGSRRRVDATRQRERRFQGGE
jgi:hypothetical protein